MTTFISGDGNDHSDRVSAVCEEELSLWIADATILCSPTARDRVRAEVGSHYHAAVARYRAEGLPALISHRAAINALGSSRALRRHLLTRREEAFVAWLANPWSGLADRAVGMVFAVCQLLVIAVLVWGIVREFSYPHAVDPTYLLLAVSNTAIFLTVFVLPSLVRKRGPLLFCRLSLITLIVSQLPVLYLLVSNWGDQDFSFVPVMLISNLLTLCYLPIARLWFKLARMNDGKALTS